MMVVIELVKPCKLSDSPEAFKFVARLDKSKRTEPEFPDLYNRFPSQSQSESRRSSPAASARSRRVTQGGIAGAAAARLSQPGSVAGSGSESGPGVGP